MEHRHATLKAERKGARMIYDVQLEEFYDCDVIESHLDDDEIDAAEAGFMRGYLGGWRGF